MKNLLKLLPTLAVLAIAGGLLAHRALAADVWVGALTSSDAGATNTLALQTFQSYDIWCNIPAVFKTDVAATYDGGISMSVDVPAQVFQQPASTAALSYSNWNGAGLEGGTAQSSVPRGRFYSGFHNMVVALAIDGGNPACTVSLLYGGQ